MTGLLSVLFLSLLVAWMGYCVGSEFKENELLKDEPVKTCIKMKVRGSEVERCWVTQPAKE